MEHNIPRIPYQPPPKYGCLTSWLRGIGYLLAFGAFLCVLGVISELETGARERFIFDSLVRGAVGIGLLAGIFFLAAAWLGRRL